MSGVLEIDSLFSDYVSTQMAEGHNQGNHHPFSSAVCSLPSHFTNPPVLQKERISLQGNGLASLHGYVTRSLKGRSVPKTLQVGQGFQLEYQECLHGSTGFSTILCGHSFKRPYNLSDLGVEQCLQDIWSILH